MQIGKSCKKGLSVLCAVEHVGCKKLRKGVHAHFPQSLTQQQGFGIFFRGQAGSFSAVGGYVRILCYQYGDHFYLTCRSARQPADTAEEKYTNILLRRSQSGSFFDFIRFGRNVQKYCADPGPAILSRLPADPEEGSAADPFPGVTGDLPSCFLYSERNVTVQTHLNSRCFCVVSNAKTRVKRRSPHSRSELAQNLPG